jgi:uncharacterized protein
MTPLDFMLVTFLASILAGLIGSVLGLGGGIIVVPTLTLLLGVNIRFAIAASIVSVIATSIGAAAAYVREHLTNLRLAMVLELATTAGALCGAYMAGLVPAAWLQRIFGILLVYAAIMMLIRTARPGRGPAPPDPLADRLRLHNGFYDPWQKLQVNYSVCRTWLGLVVSGLAGAVSGLLGVGGGLLKVPVMTLGMRVPIKAATATSNFMIGVTAAASAGVYFLRGDIDPFIAAPVVLGITIGAYTGSRLLGRLRSSWVRLAFVVILLIVSFQMLTRQGG